MWGILPRLAHSLFQERDSDPDKQQTWKIKMKYFQVSVVYFVVVGDESRRGEGGRGGREREYALRGAELGGAGLGGVCVWSCRRGRESKTQGDEGTYLSCTSRSQRSASCEVGDWGLGHGERRGRGASHGR